MIPNAVGLVAVISARSARAPPGPASDDWSVPPTDTADTSKHTCIFRVYWPRPFEQDRPRLLAKTEEHVRNDQDVSSAG